MTTALVEISDRQDRTEAHLIELQEIMDERHFNTIANNIGTNIIPEDVPAELQSVK
jgi:hypothetical protein